MDTEIVTVDAENGESVQRLHNMLFQTTNCDFEDSASDVSEDFLEERDEDTNSEQSGNGSDSQENLQADTIIYGKDKKTKWTRQVPPRNRRTPKKNIVSHLPGTKGVARNARTPIECWDLIFDTNMLDKIVECTNYQISLVKKNYSRDRDARDTNQEEIRAYIGLLYMLGVKKLNRTPLEEIWATDMTGEEFSRCVMSMRRFKFISQQIRFDNKASRAERKKTDKLAPIRDIFEDMIKNSQSYYTVSEYTTVDEKLEAFRGRCSFRQYIPSKPAKYGIKIFALCDARTYYTLNMEIYCGKQPPGPRNISTTPQSVVMRLSAPIHGTGRNITMDNWFTSYPLSQELLLQKVTMVGTCRKNKREWPLSISFTKNRPISSSEFFFDSERTLVSYYPKKNKVVILLSTMHNSNDIDETTGDAKKPEIVTFYNLTKSGVDTVDQLCSTYNVARNTRRWPMVVFYSLLNVIGINSFLIYSSNNQESLSRRLFLKKLSHELVEHHVKRRCYTNSLPTELSLKVKKLYNIIAPVEVTGEVRSEGGRSSKRRCYLCPCKNDRKSAICCAKCKNNICLKEHALYICNPNCKKEYQNGSDSDSP